MAKSPSRFAGLVNMADEEETLDEAGEDYYGLEGGSSILGLKRQVNPSDCNSNACFRRCVDDKYEYCATKCISNAKLSK